jgi:drug/metabolite transporter (DMT)-like permease
LDQAILDSVVFGLGAAVFYAAGDIVAKKVVGGRDARVPLFLFTLLSIPLVSAVIWIFAPTVPSNIAQPLPLLYAFGAAVFVAAGYHVFYRGLETGRVSVLAPLTGLYSVVTVAGGMLFFHDAPGSQVLLAVGLAIAGTFLSSFQFGAASDKRGSSRFAAELPAATKGMFAFGIGILISALSVRAIGPYWDMLVERLWRLLFTGILYFGVLKANFSPSKWPSFKMLGLMAVLDTTAALCINLALSRGVISVAVPITAVSPSFVVLLGLVYLHEKVSDTQKAGIALVLASIVIISLA